MLTTINAIIFDMDGVIFDSEKVYFDAFFSAADKNEVEVSGDEFVHSFAGKTSQDCLAILQKYLNDDAMRTQQFFRDWADARLTILAQQGLSYKNGFLPLFEAVKASGRDIGLVTSAYRADVEKNFSHKGDNILSLFTHTITINDIKNPKPHPEPYQTMIRQLGHRPEQCIVIEDSVTGVTAALDAGANTIMINDITPPPPDIAERLLYHASHHDDILAFLQERGL